MELEPKYKLGDKVWFIAENNHICYGTICMITPVNYTLLYNMRLVLNSVGEVMKNNIDERNILGPFNLSSVEVLVKGMETEYAKMLDARILENLFQEGVKITCIDEKGE